MTNNTPEPDIAKIRQLLLAAFTPEELRRFCYDRPTPGAPAPLPPARA